MADEVEEVGGNEVEEEQVVENAEKVDNASTKPEEEEEIEEDYDLLTLLGLTEKDVKDTEKVEEVPETKSDLDRFNAELAKRDEKIKGLETLVKTLADLKYEETPEGQFYVNLARRAPSISKQAARELFRDASKALGESGSSKKDTYSPDREMARKISGLGVTEFNKLHQMKDEDMTFSW